MERLFSPCTRLHDILDSQGRLGFREIPQELNLDVSTKELLSASRAFTYADLYAMLRNEYSVAWLSPRAAVSREGKNVVHYWGTMDESCCFYFSADRKGIVALARSPEHLLEICNVVLRLLAASDVHSVKIQQPWSSLDRALIIAPNLAYLMEQCQSLKVLSLEELALDKNHCRVLGAYSRPGLEIELIRCKLTSALAEVLGRN
jgi:hypothetical protein